MAPRLDEAMEAFRAGSGHHDDRQLADILSKNRTDLAAWKAETTFLSNVEAKKSAMDVVK